MRKAVSSTEAVRRKPYSVVLFDEIEKAHSDVSTRFLQVLDDGRLTDGQGRTVDFRNTVLIMTSNIGSQYLVTGLTGDGALREDARGQVLDELRLFFRPEFLNRVDEIVLFKPLTEQEIERIVELMCNDLRNRLGEQQIRLEMTPEALRHIAQEGYDPVYGARPLRRFIARELETRIGRALLGGEVHEGARVRVTVSGTQLRDRLRQRACGRSGRSLSRVRTLLRSFSRRAISRVGGQQRQDFNKRRVIPVPFIAVAVDKKGRGANHTAS